MTSSSRRAAIARALVVGRNPKLTILRVLGLVLAVVLVRQYVLLPIQVIGPSMLPTYQDHGINLVNRLAYCSHPPARGDMVAIRTSGESVMFMKRVIGLPGETVAFHEGHAIINGRVLDEPYLIYPSDWETEPRTVEPGHYLVVGDNRSMPVNFHTFGETARERIVGKILLCKNMFASPPPPR